jgi:hypothetical protein
MSLIYDEDYAHFELECDCSHAILQLLIDKIEEEGYWTLYEMSFSTYQRPFFENLKTNLKMIWSILRGRRFCLYSILIPKERMEEFKKFVADI